MWPERRPRSTTPPLDAEGREDGDRGGAVEQLTEDLVFAEVRERKGELVLGGVLTTVRRVVRLSALAGGDLALRDTYFLVTWAVQETGRPIGFEPLN